MSHKTEYLMPTHKSQLAYRAKPVQIKVCETSSLLSSLNQPISQNFLSSDPHHHPSPSHSYTSIFLQIFLGLNTILSNFGDKNSSPYVHETLDMEIPYAPENKENSLPDDDYLQFGPPHEAMFFVLAYLPLLELLAMSQVCRSVRDALSNDILPWINITVYKPLSQRLSDDILMKFASKANGKLTTLALINCEKITDDGLQRVVSKNPLIDKLYLPACTSLTPEGIIRAVEALTKHNHQILHSIRLKINGIHNMKKEQLEMLRSLIGLKQAQQQQAQRRNLYHKHNTFSASTFGHEEDKCSIDVDICPKCNEVRMVFDCPMDRCERKRQNLRRECRGCCFCIPRCGECGRCIESDDQVEAACTDNLCSGCWLQLPKCNFCNRPYCNQHANQKCSVPGSSGFVCDACHSKYIENS